MPSCKDINNKYIKVFSDRISVIIEHFKYRKDFFFINYASYRKTLSAAIEHRNEVYKEKTGTTISTKTIHFKSRSNDPRLLPGISFGYSKGKKTYVVLTLTPNANSISTKIRFSIKKLGEDTALNKAKEELLKYKNNKEKYISDLNNEK